RLRYASRTISLFPPESKEEEPSDSKKTDAPPKKAKKSTQKIKPNFEQISYSLDVLPGVLLRALRRTGRKVRITPLKVHLLIALEDPADTAVLYGRLHGVLNATLPLLHRTVRIDDQDIQLFPDFTRDGMDCIADVGVKIRPLDLLGVAVLAAAGVIKWYIGYKKRADKPDPSQKQKQECTAHADPAA
ncbi:MAG: DUF2953 domain-containing protein, partial [Oscillospiraceae bacterium]|nr:DUF2953 domain-containing protein [Oscillospiraceae bacterium]